MSNELSIYKEQQSKNDKTYKLTKKVRIKLSKRLKSIKLNGKDKVQADMDKCIIMSKSYGDFKKKMQIKMKLHYASVGNHKTMKLKDSEKMTGGKYSIYNIPIDFEGLARNSITSCNRY